MKYFVPAVLILSAVLMGIGYLRLYGFGGVSKKERRPNFVIFFADDIGWGDYGANWKLYENVTVNLNKMARRGMRLTDFHVGASVCAPSRAALLTGRLGLRTGLITNFRPGSVGGLPVNETTLAEVLRFNGYRTGMIGKWHLGTTKKFHPNSRGFDYYYGLPYSNDMGCVDVPTYNRPTEKLCPKHPPESDDHVSADSTTATTMHQGESDDHSAEYTTALPLYENRDIIEQPANLIHLGDHYASKAEKFLSLAAEEEDPFFLYVAFAHMHVPHAHAKRFSNSTDINTVYTDTLHELDTIIGRILRTLHKHGMEENTIVWFTGDNGPWVGKCEYAGNPGPFLGSWLTRTYGGGSTAKCTTWEAGHREPTVVMWPGRIPANTTSDSLMSSMDIFPTILNYAGADMPKHRRFDGINVADILEGKSAKGHDVLYHPNSGVTLPHGEIDTIRMGSYKIFWKTGGTKGCSRSCDGREAPQVSHDPPLIFNVEKDPAESTPVTEESDPNYETILASAIKLRKDIIADIKSDNTSVADYKRASWADPCCDATKFLCRCKRDLWGE